jgi:hypothetical protein
MPRLRGYQDRIQHDFAWNVWLEPGDSCWLFARPDTIKPPDKVTVLACGVDHYASFADSLIVLDVALSRTDAVLELTMNDVKITFSGPWMSQSAICLHDFMGIYLDAIDEMNAGKRKKTDAIAILGEVIRLSKWSGVFRPGVLPCHKPLAADLRLLPDAPAGFVTVHVRVLFTVEVRNADVWPTPKP